MKKIDEIRTRYTNEIKDLVGEGRKIVEGYDPTGCITERREHGLYLIRGYELDDPSESASSEKIEQLQAYPPAEITDGRFMLLPMATKAFNPWGVPSEEYGTEEDPYVPPAPNGVSVNALLKVAIDYMEEVRTKTKERAENPEISEEVRDLLESRMMSYETAIGHMKAALSALDVPFYHR